MIARALAIFVAGFCLLTPAFADDAPPGTGDARYSFNKVDGGYLRLDTQTGEVSLCSQRTVGWACVIAPEDRAALEDEITRLRRENGALKKDMLAHGLPLPGGAAPQAQTENAQNHELTLRLPSDAEVDRFTAYVGRVWHRLVDAIAQAKKQVLDKS
jgi:hypothetical protein